MSVRTAAIRQMDMMVRYHHCHHQPGHEYLCRHQSMMLILMILFAHAARQWLLINSQPYRMAGRHTAVAVTRRQLAHNAGNAYEERCY